ncbi:unnamed protein product [Prunus armeniaca]|uniref:Uncharacterized protein n=1 Tax=Prunus armeniaca TaxID=36596 RepID=A0A6J5XBP2_PRUAR|nr:unnamed protein product [Prunus armeniaca]
MAALLRISINPNPLANKMSRSNPSRPSRTTMDVMSQDHPFWASVHAEIEVPSQAAHPCQASTLSV